ncbi:MAG TPA: phage baseplate assembly protein V [Polyangia bacterium]|nr:phage baseplate assembly protein V [Polyangia bacterium]
MSMFKYEKGVGSVLHSNSTTGVMTALVTNIVHENNDYRVKVRFPTLPNGGDNGEESTWCRIITVGAGKDCGTFWLPEVGDEVLVSFLNGDFNQPVVLGSLWNGVEPAPYANNGDKGVVVVGAEFDGKHEAKKNDLRFMRSRVGHQLIFNDNASEPRVALHSKQKHRIVLDDKGNEPTKIEIYDGKEENYVLIDTKNKKITIETKTGDMLLKAKGTITVDAETIEMKSSKNTTLDVGQNFEMKAKSNMTIKASGSGDVESSGAMTIKGSKVNIN